MAAYYRNAPLPDTNARQPSITMRPSSTALLTIDSEDRYTDYTQARTTPTSPYNFTIVKNESLMAGFFTRLAVTEINFPWTIPNINQKTNKILITYTIGGTTTALRQITIATGFYTPSELAAYLQTVIRALDAGLSTFTMTYGTIPGVSGNDLSFTYETNNPANVVSFDPMPYNSAAYPYSSQTKQLYDVLGFNDSNGTPETIGTGNFTLCQAIRYVDVVCNQLTSVSSVKDQTSQTIARDMLCRIYLGDGGGTGQSTTAPDDTTFCPPGCAPMTIYRNFTNPKQIAWIPNQNIPGFLQFEVYDDAGDLLSNSILVAGIVAQEQSLNWSMTILVSEN